jgi:hypothetical protein
MNRNLMAEPWAEGEAAGARLGDARRVATLARVLTALAVARGQAWSAALGPGLRQAGGDLVRLSGLSVVALLAGHFAATARRCAAHALVLIAADTTAFNFSGLRSVSGLGSLGDGGHARGLWVHSAMALSPDGQPLGLLDLRLWARPGRRAPKAERPYRERESYKWEQALHAVAARLAPGQRAVVVTDRESDVFEYLSAPRPPGLDLLVRAAWPRNSAEPEAEAWRSVLTIAADAAPLAWVALAVPATRGREARRATLVVRAKRVRVRSPRVWPARRRCELPLTVVLAEELEPPVGVPPLRWVLLTTLAVETADDALAVLGYYQRRWRIETQHEGLKTEGLRVERLRLRSASALKRALALYYVVAWRAMDLCYSARSQPDQPARERFSQDDLEVLGVLAGSAVETLGDAVAWLAKLGGWEGYPSSPPYGPKAVQRGLVRLEAMVTYHRLARQRGPDDL